MLTGTIRSQVQLQMLDQKWQKKKTDMAAGKKEDKELTAEEREWQNYQDQMDKIRESDSYSQIYTKLKSGGTLTEEEIQRLKERIRKPWQNMSVHRQKRSSMRSN